MRWRRLRAPAAEEEARLAVAQARTGEHKIAVADGTSTAGLRRTCVCCVVIATVATPWGTATDPAGGGDLA